MMTAEVHGNLVSISFTFELHEIRNREDAIDVASKLSRWFEAFQHCVPLLYKARTSAVHYLHDECGLKPSEISALTDISPQRTRMLVKDRRIEAREILDQ